MEDTSGFYKINEIGNLMYGPNFVCNADYKLTRETKDQNIYPIDGWFWFNSESEAKSVLI